MTDLPCGMFLHFHMYMIKANVPEIHLNWENHTEKKQFQDEIKNSSPLGPVPDLILLTNP